MAFTGKATYSAGTTLPELAEVDSGEWNAGRLTRIMFHFSCRDFTVIPDKVPQNGDLLGQL